MNTQGPTMTKLEFGPREISGGVYNGVDFGPRWWIIARSPKSMLLWIFAHSYSINGNRNYAEPHLTLVPRGKRADRYESCHDMIGRLTGERASEACSAHPRFNEFFPRDDTLILTGIAGAVTMRKTVIIDGGGEPLPQRR